VDGAWRDVREGVDVDFDEDRVPCTELVNKMRSRFEPESEQCAAARDEHFYNCCFEKCNLCGDSLLDWDGAIFFSGNEVPCSELDSKIFVEEGISADSSRCEISKDFYADSCCIQPPNEPCNICRSSSGVFYNMNSSTEVSFDGEVKTCLEVYHSMYSRREQSSEQCIAAQGELFDKCCEATDAVDGQTSDFAGDSSFSGTVPSTTPVGLLPTPKPAPDFQSWYQDSWDSSDAKDETFVERMLMFVVAAVPLFMI
jgi:hypothetical protein